MANRIKGEVELEARGEVYILHLDFNRLCENEADLPGIMDGGFKINTPTALRTALRVALIDRHPECADVALGDKLAASIVSAIGIAGATTAVQEATAAAFGPREAPNGSANPPPAAATPPRRLRRGNGLGPSASG